MVMSAHAHASRTRPTSPFPRRPCQPSPISTRPLSSARPQVCPLDQRSSEAVHVQDDKDDRLVQFAPVVSAHGTFGSERASAPAPTLPNPIHPLSFLSRLLSLSDQASARVGPYAPGLLLPLGPCCCCCCCCTTYRQHYRQQVPRPAQACHAVYTYRRRVREAARPFCRSGKRGGWRVVDVDSAQSAKPERRLDVNSKRASHAPHVVNPTACTTQPRPRPKPVDGPCQLYDTTAT